MKFDYIIGNPPYQESRETTKDMPVYNSFMDGVYSVCDKVMLITPGRFLFNAGATPKKWNEKMLQDPHFTVLHYEGNSLDVFPNADIEGGVAIHYHDNKRIYGAIDTFIPFAPLQSIKNKVVNNASFKSLLDIITTVNAYHLDSNLYIEHPELKGRMSKGNETMLQSNVFESLPEVFREENLDEDVVAILGRAHGERVYRYILKKYISVPDSCYKYKVFVPAVNGCNPLNDFSDTPVIGIPLIGNPLEGHTTTFLSIGSFDSIQDAERCMKYIKSKFARVCLGILKITQHNLPSKWKYVPLQDFTSSSDIDWAVSIPNIDRQLYRKYGLTQEEIDFIETHVKKME